MALETLSLALSLCNSFKKLNDQNDGAKAGLREMREYILRHEPALDDLLDRLNCHRTGLDHAIEALESLCICLKNAEYIYKKRVWVFCEKVLDDSGQN